MILVYSHRELHVFTILNLFHDFYVLKLLKAVGEADCYFSLQINFILAYQTNKNYYQN